MRHTKQWARLAATTLVVGAVAAPAAGAAGPIVSERVGGTITSADPSGPVVSERVGGTIRSAAPDPMDAVRRELAKYGITGTQAESYINQRADNPNHTRITPRSLFHAGDPGADPAAGA